MLTLPLACAIIFRHAERAKRSAENLNNGGLAIMSTFMPKADEIERKWYVIDAADKPLGRVAAEAATLLRGKHKPIFAPHVDCGDFVIIINTDKAVLTGDKLNKKLYQHQFSREDLAPEIQEYYAAKPEVYPDFKGGWQPHYVFVGEIIDVRKKEENHVE